jgi:Cft2 family RNA processing exonuclease
VAALRHWRRFSLHRRLVDGIDPYAYDPPTKPAATALVDCSYGDYDRPIGECWSALEPLAERGPLLLPVPANGRGPEIALEFLRYGRTDIYVDDDMNRVLRRLCTTDTASARDYVDDDLKALAVTTRPIEMAQGVMIAGSADGTSGASQGLLAQWEHASAPAIVFTGYRAPDTPADRLIKSGRAQFLRWNVHPRLANVVALVHEVKAKTVIPAFCDHTQLPALARALLPARVTMEGPVEL